MTSLSIKTRTQFRMPAVLVRPSSGRWGPSLAAPRSGVQEQLSNPSTSQPSNSWSSVCGASPQARSREGLLGHRKSVMLLSRQSSSCRLAPECEGQVVVVVPQPQVRGPSPRSSFCRNIKGQQYVVRQLLIQKKQHLMEHMGFPIPTLLSRFNFLGKCSHCV
jgi:hypothetical protein